MKDKATEATFLHEMSERRLYRLQTFNNTISSVVLVGERASFDKCHRCPGYLNSRMVQQVIRHHNFSCLGVSHQNNCISYLFGKFTHFFLPLTGIIRDHTLDLVFSGVWGPSPMSSIDGHKHFVFFS